MKLLSAFLIMATIVISGCQSTELSKAESITVQPGLIKALIIDGQNNHIEWPKTTMLMKQLLEQTGRFEVDIERTQFTWQAKKFAAEYPLEDGKTYVEGNPKTDPNFAPKFSDYDVVISNFGWRAAPWPKTTKTAFEQYMRNGGGFVVVHAADNSFPLWKEFNKMIGLGGWGGRNEKDGPYVYFDDSGKLIRDMQKGQGGGHGKQHEFEVVTRESAHPIMQGLAETWLHNRDELYNRLRGPAENMTVLASAFDDPKYGGSGRHEPVLMAIDYHQGRVFHSTLGHSAYAMESELFIQTFVRGAAWAAKRPTVIE